MIRICFVVAAFLITLSLSASAEWDYSYEADDLPTYPINAISEVTHFTPDDTREINPPGLLHIVDTSLNRTRYRVDLDSLYGAGVEAGTIETRQRFVSSSDFNNAAIMMRQDTPDESAEIRIGYFDAGDGRRGLWNACTGEFLGCIEPTHYYKIRMVLDGAQGGRLYVDDSFFAQLTPAPGGTSRLAFGAFSTLGTAEIYIDYFRWKKAVKAGPGESGDPGEPSEIISPRIIAAPQVTPSTTSAVITWITDTPCDSTVRYGTTWNLTNEVYDFTQTTYHSITLQGLSPGTTYRFSIESKQGEITARSGIFTFTTEDVFRISSGPFVKIYPNGRTALITWNTSFTSDSKVFYRQKNSGSWLTISNSTPKTLHSITLAELIPNTSYEFYTVSSRSGYPDLQSATIEFFTYVYADTSSALTNGSFESGSYTGWIRPDASDPGTAHTGPWFGIMPHSGNYFLGADSIGSARNGVIYQSATNLPQGTTIYASAWVRTFETNASGEEEHNSAFCQIGIDVAQDPNGTIDPNAPSIRWSAPIFTYNNEPWVCIAVSAPRGAANFATVFIKHIQTADGGINVTAFDDVVLRVDSTVVITSGPNITQVDASTAKIEWSTNVESSTFVQFGQGTPGDYQYTDHYLDAAPKTNHEAVLKILPATSYVFQAGSASNNDIALSAIGTFSSPMNEQLLNGGFEETDSRGRPRLGAWIQFSYDINSLPRFNVPEGQPAGEAIDGLIGAYPYGGRTWHGITCEPSSGSYMIGGYAAGANKNGGVLQKVKVTQGQIYMASMRFLTKQTPIDSQHPKEWTACAIAIDPTGGTNILSPNLVWSTDAVSEVNGQWDSVSVRARAASDVITIFCVIEQRYENTTHLAAIDNVALEESQPFSGAIGEIKLQPSGTPVHIEDAKLIYAKIPVNVGATAKLYIEEADRSSGIGLLSTDPILWSNPPLIGDGIAADGVITVVNGEAVISNAMIAKTPGQPQDAPPPLMINLRALGGGGFGLQPPMSGGAGLNNVGLLIKSAGKVTSGYPGGSGWITDQQGRTCAYVDDGSGLDYGLGAPGIKIVADPIVQFYRPIKNGNIISFVGVCSAEQQSQIIMPVVLISDWTKITVLAQ